MTITRHQVGPRLTQAVVHSATVYLAGQVSAAPAVKAQTEEILKRIDELLTAVGSHKSKLLAATIYLANMAAYDEMNAVWDAWVDPRNTPARGHRGGAAGVAQISGRDLGRRRRLIGSGAGSAVP